MRYVAHRHRRFYAGWLITLCWLLPVLALFVAAGYALSQTAYITKKFMPKSFVQTGKPHPMPLLTPDEASRVAKDQASPVWSEGVKSSDVPKLDPNDYAAESGKNFVFPSRHHHHGLSYRHGLKAVSTDKDDATPPDGGTTEPPAPPNTDNSIPSTSPSDAPPAPDSGGN